MPPKSDRMSGSATLAVDSAADVMLRQAGAIAESYLSNDRLGAMDEASVTQWIERLKEGESAAAQRLWQVYFEQLVNVARRRLGDVPRRAADEEDVALSAFKSFCMGALEGRYPKLTDRHDLWSLLVAITAHKASDMVRHEQRQKRGGGKLRDQAGLSSPDFLFQRVISSEPTPAFAAQVAEQFDGLLDRLTDPMLREIAVWKMEGFTVIEIASKLDCAERTVKRKLQRIRTLWTVPSSESST